MTIQHNGKNEVLCIAYSAWGHARPMCSLAAIIAQQPGHHVTVICIPYLFDKAVQEVATHFSEERPEKIQEFVTVIAITEQQTEFLEYFRDEYYATLADTFKTLSIKCGKTGKTYALSAPDVMIGDIMSYDIMPLARKLLPSHVKCIVLFPGSAYLALLNFAPEKYGGFGDFEAKAIAEMQRSGKDIMTASSEVFYAYTGSVIDIPGLPPFYDYEKVSQITGHEPYAIVQLHCHKYLADCDGAIVMSSSVFEPEAIRVLKQWFSDTDRPLYAIGPLLPLKHYKDGHNELITGSSNDGKEVLNFLDDALTKHGEKSLVYVSLGTVYWPIKPEMIYSLIEELIEAKIPFLFTHASSRGKDIPEELKNKVKASGLGYINTWSPQKKVLAHPVTGWHVSHCGQNGSLETFTYGVPIIAWPFEYDQSFSAMLVSLVHEVGYELLQVRTGKNGLKKPYRAISEDDQPKDDEAAWRAEMRSVLKRARGGDGERKRANILKMKARIWASWQEGGETMNEFRSFLSSIDENKI